MSQLQEFKCPCCGGSIEFNSGIGKMKCPYCDTEFDMEAMRSDEAEWQDAPEGETRWEKENEASWQEEDGVSFYVCRSCGGEIVCEETTAATACPYCGNPVVMRGRVSGELKPDLVIPFKLDKEAAKAGLRRHLKGKRLLPKVFQEENHLDEIKGVYVPFWLFDSDADAKIRYHATRTRFWSDSHYNYTETSHFSLLREGSLGFEHVPVDGSVRMDDALMESIEPYDFREAVDFQTAYLSGYLADRYDVDADASAARADERIRRTTEQRFASTAVGYATVLPEHSQVTCQNGRVRYALLPVWLLNTTWQGQRYTFAMNGQTGKFVGNLPMDKGAYARYFGLIFGAVTALALGALWLLSL